MPAPRARVVVLVAFAVSCSVDLTPPGDVTITCTSNEQCPTSYRCSSQLQRCVPGGQEDVPPKILNLTAVVERDLGAAAGIAVEAATVGSTVRVRFQVDEELLEAPQVKLSWPDDASGFSRQAEAGPTSGGYEMVTTIVATDPVGAVSVSVIAIDLASNVGNAELPRHFLVDTTPFLLSSVSLRPRSPVPTELTAIGVAVTAARNEVPGIAEIEAQLVFSKPPRQKPVISLEGPGGSIDGVVSALATTSFAVTFEIDDALLTADAGDTFELAVVATDAAGITWTPAAGVELPTIVVDTMPPVMPASLRFLRAPWGAGDALPVRTFAVESTSAAAVIGTAGGGERLFVYDSASASRARLGFTALGVPGTLPNDRLTLATADRLDVFASLIDGAGNEGPSLRVGDGTWVATFKGRTTGNDFLNPNRLTKVSQPGDALFDSLATEATTADIAKTVLADGNSYVHSVSSGLWRFRRLGSPPAQAAGGAVYVPSTGRVQLIGGSSEEGAFPNLWDWDGNDWREVDLVGSLWPGENFGPSMAHDSGRNRTVYHGGTVTGTPGQRTWEYDGTTWVDATPGVPGPPSVFAPMVYDAVAGVMVLYAAFEEPVGGVCASGSPVQVLVNKCLSTTTWLWDGTAWESVPCQGGACPPPRVFAGMAYDPESRRVVLFGGSDSVASGSSYGDLWEWDTETRTWTEVTPASGLIPSPRRSAIMSYVAGFGGVLIWGGCEAGDFFDCAKDADGSDNLDDYLVWRGSAATPTFATVTVEDPPNLGGPLASRGVTQGAYIPAIDQLLVFGGVRQVNVVSTPDCAPYARACDGTDPRQKGPSGNEVCACAFDTGWLLQPTDATHARWQQAAGKSAVHSPTSAFSLTYSPTQHRAYIFGGRRESGDLDCDGSADHDSGHNCHSMWSWDGVHVRPELAFDDPSALIPATNIVDVLQCGASDDAAPCGQESHEATYLPLEQHVAYFDQPEFIGPGGTNRGLWRYNDGTPPYFVGPASAVSLAEAPPRTEDYGLATSVVGPTESVYFFGGLAEGSSCNALNIRYSVALGSTQPYGVDTPGGDCLSRALWRWTAGSWELFLPAIGDTHWPSPRSKVGMVDIDAGNLFLFGGCIAITGSNDCGSQDASSPTNGDSWVLSPAATPVWSCVSGSGPSCPAPLPGDPGPLSGLRLAWDSALHRVLMFGGSAEGDGPGPNSLWAWREQPPPLGVSPPYGTWSEIVIDGVRPLTRRRHGLAYDSGRNVLMLAGEGRAGEIWELRLDPHNRPVLVFDFALRAAGLSEASGVARASATVQVIRFIVDVAASGFSGAAADDGLFVQLWNSGLARWFDVGQSTGGGTFVGTCDYDSDASRPGRQVVCTLAGDDARAMVFAGDDHIYARIAPAGGIGPTGEAAVLALDAVRLEVDYALP